MRWVAFALIFTCFGCTSRAIDEQEARADRIDALKVKQKVYERKIQNIDKKMAGQSDQPNTHPPR